jgi:hypothetical protein
MPEFSAIQAWRMSCTGFKIVAMILNPQVITNDMVQPSPNAQRSLKTMENDVMGESDRGDPEIRTSENFGGFSAPRCFYQCSAELSPSSAPTEPGDTLQFDQRDV